MLRDLKLAGGSTWNDARTHCPLSVARLVLVVDGLCARVCVVREITVSFNFFALSRVDQQY